MPTNDNRQCPQCQRANHCAIANNAPAADCWCMHSAPAGLDHNNAERCLCQQCLEKQREYHADHF